MLSVQDVTSGGRMMTSSAQRQAVWIRPLLLLAASCGALLVIAALGTRPSLAAEVPPCLKGNYADGDDCVPAPPGSFVPDDGATSATLCPAGQFSSSSGAVECAQAPAGSFVSTTGATSATLCPAGQFQPEPGQDACREADEGRFARNAAREDGTGAVTQTRCPVGRFQPLRGQSSCLEADDGSFARNADREDGTGARQQTRCAAGSFQPARGQGSCIPAPAGSFVPTTGAKASALCTPGTYMPTAGASVCTRASVGNYVPRAGATAQLVCATATVTGSATCPAPTIAPAMPSRPADEDDLPATGDPCPPGTWSATGTIPPGSTCTPARPGTVAAGPGATVEEECPPGTYSDVFGGSVCSIAPAGTFVAGPGGIDPVPCETAVTPGAAVCAPPVAAATAAPTAASGSSSGSTMLLIVLGLVMAVGVVAVVILQRLRPDLLPRASRSGTGTIPTASPRAPSVGRQPGDDGTLEWDEAFDDPDTEPPPAPR
jgi:hypothetical protein